MNKRLSTKFRRVSIQAWRTVSPCRSTGASAFEEQGVHGSHRGRSLLEFPDEILSIILQSLFTATEVNINPIYGCIATNRYEAERKQRIGRRNSCLSILLACKQLHTMALPLFFPLAEFRVEWPSHSLNNWMGMMDGYAALNRIRYLSFAYCQLFCDLVRAKQDDPGKILPNLYHVEISPPRYAHAPNHLLDSYTFSYAVKWLMNIGVSTRVHYLSATLSAQSHWDSSQSLPLRRPMEFMVSLIRDGICRVEMLRDISAWTFENYMKWLLQTDPRYGELLLLNADGTPLDHISIS